MIRKNLIHMMLAILTGLASLLIVQPALACSVCVGGDPNSAMNQGIQAGMFVLLGVVSTVLLGFASLLLFWVRRARFLDGQVGGQAIPSASRAPLSHA